MNNKNRTSKKMVRRAREMLGLYTALVAMEKQGPMNGHTKQALDCIRKAEIITYIGTQSDGQSREFPQQLMGKEGAGELRERLEHLKKWKGKGVTGK